MSFPACCSTSAAGSQEQPEWQWADLQDPLEICISRISRPSHHEKGVHVGVTQPPAGSTQQDTPKTQDSSGCSILGWVLDLTFLGEYRCLSAANWDRDFVPVAALRVTIWHRTRLSSAAACQSHAGPVSATRRGGITFSLRAFWKCELASFPCRKVLTILHKPLLLFLVLSLSWLVRIWLRCA